MTPLADFLHGLFSLYLSSLLVLSAVKVLRHSESEVPDSLCADDVLTWFFLVLVSCLPALVDAPHPFLLSAGFVVGAIVVLWLEAAVFAVFGVSPDVTVARAYWRDLSGAFQREKKEFKAFILRPSTLVVPLSACLLPLVDSRAAFSPWCDCALVALVGCVLKSAKSRDGYSGLVVYAAMALLASVHLSGHGFGGNALKVLSTGVVSTLILAVVCLRAIPTPSINGAAFLRPRSFLRLSAFGRARPVVQKVVPLPEDVVLLRGARPEASLFQGSCSRRSIVVVTLESVGKHYLERVQTPFLDSLRPNALVSRHHFCICPVTTKAHGALYSNGYSEQGLGEGLGAFEDAGYGLVYLTADDTRPYGLRGLLVRAGFKSVLDGPTLGISRDSELQHRGLDAALETLGDGPAFLHVHTANTHFPYLLEKSMPTQRRSFLERYRESLEEADTLLAGFFNRLRSHRLFSNALVVVTGDHGQAFGEFGYRTHSNAIAREQINVPLLLFGEGVPGRVVSWSSHFDVLPTLEDLAGVRPRRGVDAIRVGSSMLRLRRDEDLRLLLYSEGLRGAYPTNYGFVAGCRKIMIDRVFDRVVCMNLDDEERVEVRAPRRQYFVSLCDQYLREAEVVL